MSRLRRHPMAVVGGLILGAVILASVAAPIEGRQNADGEQHAGPGIAERRAGL